ncbi:Ku protein [Staphylospora marina]|uniref:non-homologous end joining protein Ku n=1 Tax=Staphylospora marina TaxID=2490858 RepID=UPI001F14D455|nr:Ku protein [Staphylospora marina]
MWKGSISFGLVNIPVKMYAATEEKDVRFRYLHRECRTPVKNVRMCPNCDRQVPWGEVVRGYEYEEGRFVVLEDEDWAALAPANNKAIEIIDFVELKEIDPVYFNKTYYLGAQDANNKAYALLREALIRTGKIGVARITIRSKEQLAVVRVYGDCLVMETIFYPDEVRDVKQVPFVPETHELNEKELTMAVQLIEQLSVPFDPAAYRDEYRNAVEDVLRKKISDEKVVEAPVRKTENVVDLMEALQASLDAARKTKTSGRKKPAAKKKATS